MRKKVLIVIAELLVPVLVVSGCSVALAASGSKEPDYAKLHVGARRPIIEQELGPPRKTIQLPSGERVVYRYKLGDQAAPGRALAFLVVDIFTFALAEYALFPYEIANSGNAYQATVEYDDRGIATRVVEKEPISAIEDGNGGQSRGDKR